MLRKISAFVVEQFGEEKEFTAGARSAEDVSRGGGDSRPRVGYKK